jgi:ribosomal subunit interface protein
MEIPVQIVVRNASISEVAKDNIRSKADKLSSFYSPIIKCRVVVEAPHRHKQKGLLYNVRIDMTVPGGELVVKREPNEDVYVAIRDAFVAARRQLQAYARRQRREVKTHEDAPRARVTKLFPDEGYGFLETFDGLDVYFHRNSVLNDGFDRLLIGTEVRYVQEQGEQGPQASTVMPVKKRRTRAHTV